MALAKYKIYALSINSNLLSGILSQSINFGIETARITADGSIDPQFGAMLRQRPMVSFETLDLKSGLAQAGLSGFKITSSATLKAWLQRTVDGGGNATGSVHSQFTVNKGLIVPRTLRAGINSYGSISYDVYVTYDGTNDPFVINPTAVLTGTPTVDKAFIAGPCYINNTLIEGIQDISIDFGFNVVCEHGNGEKGYWPEWCYYHNRMPTIRIGLLDVASIATLGLKGLRQDANDSKFFFRQVSLGEQAYGDAQLKHIKIAMDEGRMHVEEVPGSDGGGVTTQLVIEPLSDNSNDILAITTDQAIG